MSRSPESKRHKRYARRYKQTKDRPKNKLPTAGRDVSLQGDEIRRVQWRHRRGLQRRLAQKDVADCSRRLVRAIRRRIAIPYSNRFRGADGVLFRKRSKETMSLLIRGISEGVAVLGTNVPHGAIRQVHEPKSSHFICGIEPHHLARGFDTISEIQGKPELQRLGGAERRKRLERKPRFGKVENFSAFVAENLNKPELCRHFSCVEPRVLHHSPNHFSQSWAESFAAGWAKKYRTGGPGAGVGSISIEPTALFYLDSLPLEIVLRIVREVVYNDSETVGGNPAAPTR